MKLMKFLLAAILLSAPALASEGSMAIVSAEPSKNMRIPSRGDVVFCPSVVTTVTGVNGNILNFDAKVVKGEECFFTHIGQEFKVKVEYVY